MCMRTNLKRLLALTLTLTLFTPLARRQRYAGHPARLRHPGAHRLRGIFPNPRRGPLRRRQDLLV